MEQNIMRKVYDYKGHIVEYTGVPDEENPIGLFFDRRNDAPRILISASISRFLTDAVAECIINKDIYGLINILRQQGLKHSLPEDKWPEEMKSAILDIIKGTEFQSGRQ